MLLWYIGFILYILVLFSLHLIVKILQFRMLVYVLVSIVDKCVFFVADSVLLSYIMDYSNRKSDEIDMFCFLV